MAKGMILFLVVIAVVGFMLLRNRQPTAPTLTAETLLPSTEPPKQASTLTATEQQPEGANPPSIFR